MWGDDPSQQEPARLAVAPFEGVSFRPPVSAGEVGRLVRSMDWSATAVGPRDLWPRSLSCVVDSILELPTPAIVFWGPERTQIYNEGYAMIMGPRHPRYLGAPFRECWPEAYPVIHPWMERVTGRGEAVEVERSLIPLTRHGFVEECYFSFSFSPVRDDEGRLAGVLQIVSELTERVLSERRQRTLSALAAAEVDRGAIDELAPALSGNPLDIAGFAVHLWNPATGRLDRAFPSCGAPDDSAALLQAFDSNTTTLLEAPAPLFDCLGSSAWPEPIRSACVIPIRRTRADAPLGVVTLGISPRLRFDQAYRDFFEGVSREIAMNFSTAAARQMVLEVSLRTREAEEANRELERKKSELHAIMTSLPEAANFTDLSGRLLAVNPVFTRMYGFEPEEVVGKSVELLYADPRDFKRRFASDGTSAPPIDESMHRRSDGNVFWCETITGTVRDAVGSPVGYLELRIDITARKRRDERQAVLDEAAGALISSLDCEATLEAVAQLLVPRVADRCAIRILSESGAPERDVVEDVDPARAPLERELRPPPREALRADSFMCVPLQARGRTLGVFTLACLESRRTYTDEDLAMAEDLATRISSALDNARLYADARNAIQLRDDFLSIASHELRTPLSPLKLQLQSVLKLVQERRLTELRAEAFEQLFVRAVHQVDRLSNLVEDLLDVSKLTSGRLDLELEETDLAALVREVIERVTPSARDRGSVIHLALQPEARGRWARRRLEQVLLTLLANAIKFGRGRPIEVSLAESGAGYALAVRDYGIGIDAADQARIFQRFERAVSSSSYGGLGLGLYFTQQIVRLHGGRIEVSSEPDRGATFTVWLPAEGAATETR